MTTEKGLQTKTSSKKRRKLTGFLIYPKFQLILIAFNSLATLTLATIVYLQISRMFSHFRDLGNKIQLAVDHPYFRLIEVQSTGIFYSLSVALFIGLVMSAVFTLVLSHRIAAPMVKMRNYFSSISRNGSVEEVLKFRENDFFNDLPEKVNQAFKKVMKD